MRSGPLLALLLAGCVGEFPAAPGDADPAGDALADLGEATDVGVAVDFGSDAATSPDAAEDLGAADAAPCRPEATEVCNGRDDDCDLVVDEVVGLGEACESGEGVCRRRGALGCDLEVEALRCDAVPGAPAEESCNGLDDDCDGAVDNLATLGDRCSVGQGECSAGGTLRCGEAPTPVCDAMPGEPSPEICDRLDQDCDGISDEDFADLGEGCTEGVGGCARLGARVCGVGGMETACDAVPGEPVDETCNAVDDDCDGIADEGLGLGEACSRGVGGCARDGLAVCAPDGGLGCDAVPGEPGEERCNAVDDDCDEATDEGLDLGAPCTVGVGACVADGALICDEIGGVRCSAEPGPARPEACNDLDDDCDGRIDEGEGCRDYVVQHCRFWLGYADSDNAPAAPNAIFGSCPGVEQENGGTRRCTSSFGDQRFHSVRMRGDVNQDDALAPAFTCAGGEPAMDAWLSAHCQIYLGHSDVQPREAIEALDPATCAAQIARGDAPNPRCVASGGDGLFHPMWLRGTVDDNDGFGIAFRCAADDRPERAAGVQSTVVAQLAWQFRARGIDLEGCSIFAPGRLDDVEDWPGCPREGVDGFGSHRCASSSGDGRFHAFLIGDGHNVEECSMMGIALRAR